MMTPEFLQQSEANANAALAATPGSGNAAVAPDTSAPPTAPTSTTHKPRTWTKALEQESPESAIIPGSTWHGRLNSNEGHRCRVIVGPHLDASRGGLRVTVEHAGTLRRTHPKVRSFLGDFCVDPPAAAQGAHASATPAATDPCATTSSATVAPCASAPCQLVFRGQVRNRNGADAVVAGDPVRVRVTDFTDVGGTMHQVTGLTDAGTETPFKRWLTNGEIVMRWPAAEPDDTAAPGPFQQPTGPADPPAATFAGTLPVGQYRLGRRGCLVETLPRVRITDYDVANATYRLESASAERPEWLTWKSSPMSRAGVEDFYPTVDPDQTDHFTIGLNQYRIVNSDDARFGYVGAVFQVVDGVDDALGRVWRLHHVGPRSTPIGDVRLSPVEILMHMSKIADPSDATPDTPLRPAAALADAEDDAPPVKPPAMWTMVTAADDPSVAHTPSGRLHDAITDRLRLTPDTAVFLTTLVDGVCNRTGARAITVLGALDTMIRANAIYVDIRDERPVIHLGPRPGGISVTWTGANVRVEILACLSTAPERRMQLGTLFEDVAQRTGAPFQSIATEIGNLVSEHVVHSARIVNEPYLCIGAREPIDPVIDLALTTAGIDLDAPTGADAAIRHLFGDDAHAWLTRQAQAYQATLTECGIPATVAPIAFLRRMVAVAREAETAKG
jgi:hypothetical protein